MDKPKSIEVPIVWTNDDVPIVFANAFVAQFDVDLQSHIVTVGQFSPPAFIGATEEELAAQADAIDFVPVRTIARIAFTPARMMELISALQANVDQRERAAMLRPGDPR